MTLAAVMNLLLLFLGLAAVILWIIALASWDGKCRMDCESCPFDCDEERRQELKDGGRDSR